MTRWPPDCPDVSNEHLRMVKNQPRTGRVFHLCVIGMELLFFYVSNSNMIERQPYYNTSNLCWNRMSKSSLACLFCYFIHDTIVTHVINTLLACSHTRLIPKLAMALWFPSPSESMCISLHISHPSLFRSSTPLSGWSPTHGRQYNYSDMSNTPRSSSFSSNEMASIPVRSAFYIVAYARVVKKLPREG